MDVKFLPETHIEREAEDLLAGYGARFKPITDAPVPVDEIVDCYLALRLEFADLRKELDAPDVLGAIWIEDKRVAIDESLDPSVNTHLEGRYRFTVGHEAGHWVLHREQLLAARQPGLFTGPRPPSVVCRDTSIKPPIEWQADYFASCLLMPAEIVRRLWLSETGSHDPYVAANELKDVGGKTERDLPTLEISRALADDFHVSGQAMQIRLLKLGLIVTKEQPPSLF